MSADRGYDRGFNMISARQRVVLEVVVREGEGTVASPVRHITYYLDPDGTQLAFHDGWADA